MFETTNQINYDSTWCHELKSWHPTTSLPAELVSSFGAEICCGVLSHIHRNTAEDICISYTSIPMYTIISQPIYAIYQQLSIKFRNGLVHSRAEAGCGQADQPLGLENPLATIWGPRFLGHTQRGLVCVYIHIYMSEYIYIYTYDVYTYTYPENGYL